MTRFIELKQQSETAILVDDFATASALLDVVEQECGFSWWLIEMRLLVEQRRSGLEANRGLLKRYQQSGISWLKVISGYLSQRVEDEISAEDYEDYCGFLRATAEHTGRKRKSLAYLRFRLAHQLFEDIDVLDYCLNVEESHSACDRYLTFVKVLSTLSGSEKDDTKEVTLHAAALLPDPQLKLVGALLSPETLQVDPLSRLLMQQLHDYTLGRYSGVLEAATEALQANSGVFEFYELAAKAALRMERPIVDPFKKNSIPSRILENVCHVVAQTSSSGSAVRALHKFSYQLDSFPLGNQLLSFVRLQHLGHSGAGSVSFSPSGAACATPRLCRSMRSPQLCRDFVDRLDQLYPDNAAVDLFKSARKSLDERRHVPAKYPLPSTRALKHQALVYESLNRNEEALAAYRALYAQSLSDPLLRADASGGLYRCHLKAGDTLECAEILASTAVLQPHMVADDDLREITAKYDLKQPREWYKTIAWPVLFQIARSRDVDRIEPEMMFDVLDEFFTEWGVERPSELSGLAQQFDRPSLLLVLYGACVPDILDSSAMVFDSQDEVEQERIRVCEWLVELDPERRGTYTADIAGLKSRATTREMEHTIGQNKIFVDTDGIRNSLGDSFYDRVQRCAAYAVLTDELRAGEEVTKEADESKKNVALTTTDDGFKIFRSVFTELKQKFISSNEYGLDSNLSQRIRHGTLLGEIRSHLGDANLVTERDASKTYQRNDYWIKSLCADKPGMVSSVDQSLRKLSAEVDETIRMVRDEWIQIRSAKKTNGIFDFELDDSELQPLYTRVRKLTTTNAFVDMIFDALWQRTEKHLGRARGEVTGVLRDTLFRILDETVEAIEQTVGAGPSFSAFRAAVTSCKTHLDYSLASIAEWFRVDQRQGVPPFTIPSLISALHQQVARYCGPSKLELVASFSGEGRVQGHFFRPLWDLLFIPFDNIASHSELSPCKTSVAVVQGDQDISIVIENALGPAVDREALQREATRASDASLIAQAADMIRSEGGSGFVKIHKIIKYELHCEAYTFAVSITPEDRLSVQLKIPALGFYEDNTHS